MSHEYHALKRYIETTPEKRKAYRVFTNAKNRGDIVPQSCGVCGSTERTHGHHPDYAKPLDVLWLCPRHHYDWHVEHGLGLNGGEERGEHKGRRDYTGERFGKLTVTGDSGGRSAHGAVIWALQCDCGNTRTASAQHLASLTVWQCRECADASKVRSRAIKTERMVRWFRGGLSLYTHTLVSSLTDEIRTETAKVLGFAPEPTVSLDDLRYGGADEYLDAEELRDPGMSLAEIGELEGITRERVRQIEEKALEKLRMRATERFTDGWRPPTEGLARDTEAVTALRSLGALVTIGRAVRQLGWTLYEARFWLEKLSGQRVLVATRRGHVWAEGARP